MTQNILTQRFKRRESVSVSRGQVRRNDYLTLPMPTQQFSFPIVKISDLVDLSSNQSTRFRNHNLFAAMPLLKENSETNSGQLFEKTSTTKKILTTESSNSPFYFPMIDKNEKKTDNQEERIHRNPRNLSQSVQITNNYKFTLRNEDSIDSFVQRSFDSNPIENYSKPSSSQGLRNIIIAKISQKPQEQNNQISILKNLITPQKQVHKMPQEVMDNLRTLAIRSSMKRLKIILISVQATLRISQKHRLKTKALHKFSEKKQVHKGFIDKYKIESVMSQQKKYVKMVFKKLLTYTSETKYLRECEQISNKEGQMEKDIRRIRFCALSLMFMQNLEFLTRNKNIPELLKHLLNTCLLESQERKISLFVAKRCFFLSANAAEISQERKLLFASEYFLFDIIANYLVEILNDVKFLQISHQNQTLYYYVSILNLIQILFTQHFQQVSTLKFLKIKPIQKKLTASEDMQLQIEFKTELESDETQIMLGFFQKDHIQVIITERKKWGENVMKLFKQVILNLQQYIDI